MSQISTTGTTTTRAARRRPRGSRSTRPNALLQALPWISPALVLIAGVVLFPAGVMFYNSTRELSAYGVDRGSAGLANFSELFAMDALPRVLGNTAIWVISVVVLSVVLSLALAQLLNKSFPGRTLVRLAVIVPWAASVVMTTTVFFYGLDPYYGIINRFLVDTGILSEGYGFTKNPASALAVSIIIAIFVSLPFTTYTVLAGLAAISTETLEAAKMDGSGPIRTYISVILPQLRGSIAVAALINIINVFNSLPILKIMTGSIPGNDADTVMTLIFKLIQVDRRVDLASALSVVAFLIVMVIVAAYVKIVKPMKEV